jgi:hypothetical protein
VFGWNGVDRQLAFELVPAARDLRRFDYLSFRAAQASRDPNTIIELADLVFSVRLRDVNNNTSTIRIDAYGGGIEEPYQRASCGGGVGWGNEFETIRVRIEDFTRDGATLDLEHVQAVEFLFGPSYGSNQGRLGFDELELDPR